MSNVVAKVVKKSRMRRGTKVNNTGLTSYNFFREMNKKRRRVQGFFARKKRFGADIFQNLDVTKRSRQLSKTGLKSTLKSQKNI